MLHIALGDLAMLASDIDAAEARFDAAIAILRDVDHVDANSPLTWRCAKSGCGHCCCTRTDGAGPAIRQEALGIYRTTAEANGQAPFMQQMVSTALASLAFVQRIPGDLAGGKEYIEEAIAITEGLLRDQPDNVVLHISLASNLHGLGDIERWSSDWSKPVELTAGSLRNASG